MSLLETISASTNWVTVLLAAVPILVIYLCVQYSQMPPGPIGLPYFGYYPFLSDDCHLELLKLSKKYGKVFCFTATGQLYAHIIDTNALREITLTKSDCFDNRPTSFNLFQDTFGGGLFLLEGEEWKVMRKFFVTQFKEFGMGKKDQEGAMYDSLKEVVSFLNKTGGKNFNGTTFFTDMANDVICNMIFGAAQVDDKDSKDFQRAYTVAMDFTCGVRILVAGPILKYFLIPFSPAYRKYRESVKIMDSVLIKIIRQHERDFDKNNARNIIDTYINEKKLLEEKRDPKAKYFSERALLASVLQFLGDGGLGIGYFVASILKVIASRPDVQKAIQSELDEVVGRNRLPSYQDRNRLSYTNAAIYEGLRMTAVFYLLPHIECTKETTIGGCRIPKGTIAIYNMYAILNDPDVYDEPEKFDPTRFTSVDGKKPRCEIPPTFGIGKRSCAGESLVSMQMMLFVATVLQHFDLHLPEKAVGREEDKELQILLRATPRLIDL